jgi:Peptidase family M23
MHADDSVRQLVRDAATAANSFPTPPVNVVPVYSPKPRSSRARAIVVLGLLGALSFGALAARQLVRTDKAPVGSLTASRWAFPVDAPNQYVDTYGAERMTGTQFEHAHQGVDIFAERNTPVRAVEDGKVLSVGVARIGGNRLWLRTGSGDCYYYAHLESFGAAVGGTRDTQTSDTVGDDALPEQAPALAPTATPVAKGTILGYVGSTGNAADTPPHLHFEVHPSCAGPINPNPLLQAIQAGDDTAAKSALEQPPVDTLFDGWALPFDPGSNRALAMRSGRVTRVRPMETQIIAEFPPVVIEVATDQGDCITYSSISSKDASVGEGATLEAGDAIGTYTSNETEAVVEFTVNCTTVIDHRALVQAISERDSEALQAALRGTAPTT